MEDIVKVFGMDRKDSCYLGGRWKKKVVIT